MAIASRRGWGARGLLRLSAKGDVKNVGKLTVFGQVVGAVEAIASVSPSQSSANLELDAHLGGDALGDGVFEFGHFRGEIR
ncbi:MAG: hypothetical protein Fur0042_26880 [Cyanophyceae cyanobacterium]